MTTTAEQTGAGPSYMQQDAQASEPAIASPESSTASEGRYVGPTMRQFVLNLLLFQPVTVLSSTWLACICSWAGCQAANQKLSRLEFLLMPVFAHKCQAAFAFCQTCLISSLFG